MTDLRLHAEHVGGIEKLEASFTPGVALVAGPNASNKTSMLRAIAFALGRSEVPIHSGAERARVELAVGDESAERTARRSGDGIDISGAQLVDDTELVDRFGALLEFNPLRTAVRQGGDVGAELKAPADLEALAEQRRQRLSRKRDIEAELDDLAAVESDLAAVEADLEAAREREADLEQRLQERYDEATDDDGELEAARERRADLLSERDQYQDRIEDLEAAIDRLEDRLSEVDDDVERLEEAVDADDLASLRSERASLRERFEEREERVGVLQELLTVNQETLDGTVPGSYGRDPGLVEDEITCWTCGETVPESQVEDVLDDLRSLVETEKQKLSEQRPELQSLTERIEELERQRSDLREKRSERGRLSDQLESRRESLATKRESLAEVREEISAVESEIRSLREEAAPSNDTDVERLQSEYDTARLERERLESKREELLDSVERRDRLADELDDVTEEVRTLTDRIESLEDDLRTAFNDTIAELVSVLEYDRIERIWLDGEFEVVVARDVDGSVREDALAHLSESEREMVGLVLGLAGYKVYDLDEELSVLLVDHLDAFDAPRTVRLLEYFATDATYVVAAVLPDVVDEASDDHEVVSPEPAG